MLRSLQYTCGTSAGVENDQWQILYSGSENGIDYYKMVNRKSKLCLNVPNASTSPGVGLVQYACGAARFNDIFTWYLPV